MNSESSTQNGPQHLELSADRALFEGHLQGLLLSCYEDERPMQGLIGLMDWQLRGEISQAIRAGFITGKTGEVAYLPVRHTGKTLHLLIAGCGAQRGSRIPTDTLQAVLKNLRSLNLSGLGISQLDFDSESLQQLTRETGLWTVH